MGTPSPGPGNEQQRYSLMRDAPRAYTHRASFTSIPRSEPTSPRNLVEDTTAFDLLVRPMRMSITPERDEIVQESSSKAKRKNTVSFGALPTRESLPVEPEIISRPSKGKANAYAKRVAQLNDKLRRKRGALSTLRTELAHQESAVKYKQEYVEESLKLVTDMVLAEPVPTSKLDLQASRDILLLDRVDHEEYSVKLVQLKEDLRRRETSIQHIEAKIDHALSRFLENAIAYDDETASKISEDSQASISPDKVTQTNPGEIDHFLDKYGDRRIIVEQLQELEAEHNEDLERRELLTEQEQPVSEGYARKTDAAYSQRREELYDSLQRADDEVMKAYEQCIKSGLDPDPYMTDVRTQDPDDMSMTSQDAAGNSSGMDYAPAWTDPTTFVTDSEAVYPLRKFPIINDRAVTPMLSEHSPSPNVHVTAPASASPGGSEKVERWLKTQRLQVDDMVLSSAAMSDVEESTEQPSQPSGAPEIMEKLLALEQERKNDAAQAAFEDILAGLTS